MCESKKCRRKAKNLWINGLQVCEKCYNKIREKNRYLNKNGKEKEDNWLDKLR